MIRHPAESEIVQRLVEALKPEMIILFGSWARQNNHPDSDLDLLIVSSKSFATSRSRYEEIGKAEHAIGKPPYSTDILVYSRDEFERWKNQPYHIIKKAVKEGAVLYARD